MSGSPEKLTPASKRRPCPVCGGDHKCSVGDGGLIVCGRRDGEAPGFRWLGPSKDPQFHLYRADDGSRRDRRSRRDRPRVLRTDWAATAARHAKGFDAAARAKLADALGLPPEVFDALPVGANRAGKDESYWTFPEVDGAGRVVGIARRFLDGRKKAAADGARGLTVPAGWRERGGAVYVVEGPSDALAMTAAGLACVGRPSNRGGVDHLIELLKDVPDARPVVVLGENDRRPSKKAPGEFDWPGKDGADAVSAGLAARLGRPVGVAMPPGDAKDVREWLTTRVRAGAGWADAGRELAAALAVATVAPPAALPTGESVAATEPAAKFELTDLGNARRLVARHGKDLRYIHTQDRWYVWDGSRWAGDETGEIDRRSKDSAGAIFAEAADAESPREREAVARWAIASQSAKALSATVRLARSEPGVPVCVSDLDPDPWAFNCPNGTIDLRTGAIRPHRRGDLLTQMSPVAFDPRARCPLWESFLAKMFTTDPDHPGAPGNAGLIGYVRRLFGYALTGDIREHTLPIFWGAGSNGKSTLVETIPLVLGENYWVSAPDGMLMVRRGGDQHPTELARLHRKRLVTASETEQGQHLNVSLVKRLTGGDTITARFMHKDFFQFAPTHKIVVCTNEKPRIVNSGHGMWRRVALLPFRVKFWKPELGEVGPDHLRADKTLPVRLRVELPGILNWLVAGCLEWQRDGLNPPDDIRVATGEYREQQNAIGAFLVEFCELTNRAGAETAIKDLYASYLRWCESNNDRPLGKITFNEAVEKQGVVRKRNAGNADVWAGLTIRPGRDGKVASLDAFGD